MKRRDVRGQAGTALLLVVLLMLLMGLIGFAALDTATRDLQVTGSQFRKKVAFFAAEAGVAEALETMRTAGLPSVATTQLGDGSLYPHGQPAYRLDPSVAVPVENVGVGGFPGMNLQIGQNGAPQFQMQVYRVFVQGTAPGGSLSRLEIAGGVLVAN